MDFTVVLFDCDQSRAIHLCSCPIPCPSLQWHPPTTHVTSTKHVNSQTCSLTAGRNRTVPLARRDQVILIYNSELISPRATAVPVTNYRVIHNSLTHLIKSVHLNDGKNCNMRTPYGKKTQVSLHASWVLYVCVAVGRLKDLKHQSIFTFLHFRWDIPLCCVES